MNIFLLCKINLCYPIQRPFIFFNLFNFISNKFI